MTCSIWGYIEMSKHFEVECEMNPRYKVTGRMEYYHGIYHVVEYDGETRVRVVRSYDNVYPHIRAEAYKYAAHLQAIEDQKRNK